MSEAETMRMVAKIVDETTGPMREIVKAMRSLKDMAKGVSVEGARDVKSHTEAQHKLTAQTAKLRQEVSGSFTPAMDALGLTVFRGGAKTAMPYSGLFKEAKLNRGR